MFLQWFVTSSFQHPVGQGLPYEWFRDNDSQIRLTRLAVEFAGPADPKLPDVENALHCRYRYDLVLDGSAGGPAKVSTETLRYQPGAAARLMRLFHRDKKGRVTPDSAFQLERGHRLAIETVLRPNASVISTLAQLGHPFSTRLRQAAMSINFVMDQTQLTDDRVALHYAHNPDQLQQLNRDLQCMDLGIRQMQLVSGPVGPIATFEHEGLQGTLPFHIESHGTRQFVRVFPALIQALNTGGLAVVDELDMAIHPLVLPEIIRWFHDPGRNPRNAQLWISCHNASVLDELIKEETFFCEKDSAGRTSVFGLTEIQSVRRGDSYTRKYLGGVYGAVPHLG